jgi:HD-like signal output (HDOD) protein
MKKRILFVDDDAAVLASMQRNLHDMLSMWDMEFANSGVFALQRMQEVQFDAIVSDMRMPGVDGPSLLTQVQQLNPHVVRIALSGQSDPQIVNRALRPSHQYLAKPCTKEKLTQTLNRVFALSDVLQNQALRTIVGRIDHIPSLPALYLELREQLASPECSVKLIAVTISKDMSMTAKVLQIVNSSFFGLRMRVINIEQAVIYLGTETVKSLVLSLELLSMFNESQVKKFHLQELWDSAIRVAVVARGLARLENKNPIYIEAASTAGLLHDIGVVLLATEMDDLYQEVLTTARRDNRLLTEVESETLGTDHGCVGAYLLGLWGLDNLVVEAVAFHHKPGLSGTSEFTPLTAVHAAVAIDSSSQEDYSLGARPTIDQKYLAQLGLAERVDDWFDTYRDFNQGESGNE